MMGDYLRRAVAEFVGVFALVFAGVGSIAYARTLTDVALAQGFVIAVMVSAVGFISGGHFNPAVTIAAVLDKRTETTDAVGYILAQVIGAIAAAAIVFVVAGQPAVTAGVTKPGPGVTDIGALILEIVLTAGFVLVILVSTKRAAGLAPLAIPLTLVAIHFASASLSGSSVNPARSIGSALLGADLSALWIYLVGPIVGALGGWAIYRVFDEFEVEEVAA
jgi:aquaporin Z